MDVSMEGIDLAALEHDLLDDVVHRIQGDGLIQQVSEKRHHAGAPTAVSPARFAPTPAARHPTLGRHSRQTTPSTNPLQQRQLLAAHY